MMKYVVEVIINNSATSDSICFVAFIFFIYVFFSFFLLEKQEEDHLCSYMWDKYTSKWCVLNIEENVFRGSLHV